MTPTPGAMAVELRALRRSFGSVVALDDLDLDIAPGDLVAVPAAGAYSRSMASNYNHVPRPPVVAVRDGELRTIVRRETLDDLLGLDVG